MRISLISALALTSGLAAQAAAQDTTAASKQPSAAAAPEATAAAQPAAAPASGPGPSASLGLYVFPAKGQTPEQQKQDEQTCYAWAQEQSSIDPANVKANPDSAKKAAGAKADSATAGAGVKGAAKGAVGGAVIGGITGDAERAPGSVRSWEWRRDGRPRRQRRSRPSNKPSSRPTPRLPRRWTASRRPTAPVSKGRVTPSSSRRIP